MGIPVNEEANALAKGAHQQDTPVSRDVTAFDAARQQLTRLALTMHPDRRVVSGQARRVLPGRLSRDARSLLLRLCLNCRDAAARLHCHSCCASPTCAHCPEPEMLEHLICSCPEFAAQRGVLQTSLQRLWLPHQRLDELLFPTGSDGARRDVFPHLLLWRSPGSASTCIRQSAVRRSALRRGSTLFLF
ncbi:uncharacterized protein LOC144145105 isoform X2 [Haemaphysalis longicornis]